VSRLGTEFPGKRLRVMVIGGSRSHPSHTRGLLQTVASRLIDHGARVDLWDIAEGDAGTGTPRRDASTFKATVAQAHAFVIVTPTYHNSYSGLIKHTLDQLRRKALEGKPVGLMCTCGDRPTVHAVDQLRLVVNALHGAAIPTQVIATDADFRRSGDRFELVAQDPLSALSELVQELLWFAGRALRPDPTPAAAGVGGETQRPKAVICDGLWLDDGDFPEQITRAIRYIKTNFAAGGLTLDTVAREAYMSRYHFSRSFKQATGTRFMDFLRTVRLAEACDLLSRTDQPVTTIAFEVGYRDLSHFERMFKKEFDYPPSQYRARVRIGLETPPQLPWKSTLTSPVGTSSQAA